MLMLRVCLQKHHVHHYAEFPETEGVRFVSCRTCLASTWNKLSLLGCYLIAAKEDDQICNTQPLLSLGQYSLTTACIVSGLSCLFRPSFTQLAWFPWPSTVLVAGHINMQFGVT